MCVLGAGVDGQRILWQDLQLYSVSHSPKAFIYSSSWPVPAAAAATTCSNSSSSSCPLLSNIGHPFPEESLLFQGGKIFVWVVCGWAWGGEAGKRPSQPRSGDPRIQKALTSRGGSTDQRR